MTTIKDTLNRFILNVEYNQPFTKNLYAVTNFIQNPEGHLGVSQYLQDALPLKEISLWDRFVISFYNFFSCFGGAAVVAQKVAAVVKQHFNRNTSISDLVKKFEAERPNAIRFHKEGMPVVPEGKETEKDMPYKVGNLARKFGIQTCLFNGKEMGVEVVIAELKRA